MVTIREAAILWALLSLIGISAQAEFSGIDFVGCQPTRVLDVVYNPSADPPTNSVAGAHAGSNFVVLTGSLTSPQPQPVPLPGQFPAGSEFLFTAEVYPGFTFDILGPFEYIPNQVIGTWTSRGVFDRPTSFFTSGPNDEEIGTASWQISFKTSILAPNSLIPIQLLFSSYGLRTINTSLPGTGFLARTEAGQSQGGTNNNLNHSGAQISRTYVDASGNVLIRFFFQKPVCVPLSLS